MPSYLLQEDGFYWLQEDGSRIIIDLPAVRIVDSTFVPTSGVATTARMTPPATKTIADFTAGELSDYLNPLTDPVDPGVDEYTEVAWVVEIDAPATNGQLYQFRVTDAGTPFDTYPQILEVTLGPVIDPFQHDRRLIYLRY